MGDMTAVMGNRQAALDVAKQAMQRGGAVALRLGRAGRLPRDLAAEDGKV